MTKYAWGEWQGSEVTTRQAAYCLARWVGRCLPLCLICILNYYRTHFHIIFQQSCKVGGKIIHILIWSEGPDNGLSLGVTITAHPGLAPAYIWIV